MSLEIVQGRLLGGRFKILASLGENRTGSVFLAADSHQDGTTVLVHVLQQSWPHAERAVLIAAAERWSSIRHLALTSICSVIDAEGFQAICVSPDEGIPLESFRGTLRCDSARILDSLISLCEAVELLQSRGLKGVELSPSELKLHEDGRVVIDQWWTAAAPSTGSYLVGSTRSLGLSLLGQLSCSKAAAPRTTDFHLEAYLRSNRCNADIPLGDFRAELEAIRDYSQSRVLCGANTFVVLMAFYLGILLAPIVSGGLLP